MFERFKTISVNSRGLNPFKIKKVQRNVFLTADRLADDSRGKTFEYHSEVWAALRTRIRDFHQRTLDAWLCSCLQEKIKFCYGNK